MSPLSIRSLLFHGILKYSLRRPRLSIQLNQGVRSYSLHTSTILRRKNSVFNLKKLQCRRLWGNSSLLDIQRLPQFRHEHANKLCSDIVRCSHTLSNTGILPRRQNVPIISQYNRMHTSRISRGEPEIITPIDKDPSLEWTRSGEKYLKGPDQLIPSTAMTTWHPNGAVQISKLGRGEAVNRKPISIPTMFKTAVEKNPKHPALCVKRDESWKTWTYQEYYDDTRHVAKAFIALGLERFQSVCILGFNSPEWFMANLGAILAGGIPAGIYTTNSPEATSYIAKDSKANLFIVEDEQQLAKVLQHRNSLPDLKAIVQYTGTPTTEGIMSWEQLLELGAQQSDQELEERQKQMAVNQCCTLIYTSGTTGNPKGVMLSHDNFTWLSNEVCVAADFDQEAEDVVSYLPLSHVAAQITDIYCTMAKLGTVWFADPSALRGTLVDTMKEVKPTKFLAVPRVWEKMYDKLQEIGKANAGFKLKIASWAKEQGTLYNDRRLRGEPNPETAQFKLADGLVLARIRDALGFTRCNLCSSAAAPISMEILEYFKSLNIVIGESYGLSECSGPHCLCLNKYGKIKLGSIGLPVPGVATKLDKLTPEGQGELCIGGRHVLMGYLNRENKTKEAVDEEGWLHSEDLVRIDEDGFIFITGRLKELLITAGGENVAPVPIEDNIKQALPFLSNAMVVGDKLKFLSVLLTVKTEMDRNTLAPLEQLMPITKQWVEKYGDCKVDTVKDIRTEIYTKKNAKLIQSIQRGICMANVKSVSGAQKIRKWYLLPKDFSMPGGELGPTLKLKRSVVVQKYKDVIDEIYKDGLDPNATQCLG